MRSLFLLVGLLVTALTTVAQKREINYSTAVSFSPLALAGSDNMLMLGVEHRLKDRWSFVGDAGFIFASYYLDEQKGSRGFHLRPALRLYLNDRQRGYVQAQGFYKRVNYRMHDWLGKDCVNGVPTYDQFQAFTYRKQVWGVHVLFGSNLPLSGRLLLDLYAGIGFRQKRNRVVDQPNSCYERPPGFIDVDRDFSGPSLPLGIKLVYSLR